MSALLTQTEEEARLPLTPAEIFKITAARETTRSCSRSSRSDSRTRCGSYWPRIPCKLVRPSASQLPESCRSLQSLHRLAQGTASKRALLIACPHSAQMPNFSCRIRVKASSMARKSLPSA